MPLLDALLLDPWRDPRDIYIALRTDGQRGSGTLDDPFDGGTHADTPFAAKLSFEQMEFVVHAPGGCPGLDVGDTFQITNVAGPAKAQFNGTDFTVTDILETQIVSGVSRPILFTALTLNVPNAPPDVQFLWNTPDGRITVHYTGNPPDPIEVTISWPVAKVIPDRDRGLVSFDAVSIGNINDSFAGTFPLLGAHGGGHSFRYRLTCSTLPADVTSPLSCVVTRQIHRFDEVMRAAPAYSIIHLGPGTFEARGFASPYVADSVDYTKVYVGHAFRPGQRLLGSGIGATIVKLVLPFDEINQTAVLGSPIATDHAAIAELTIDCNGPNHVAPCGIFPAPVTCGAVDLAGGFMTIRRVRAINFCVQARAECFVLNLGAHYSNEAGAVNNVIADCIVEQPGENNAHETTLIDSVGEAVAASSRSPTVRHNYVNCEYSPVPVTGERRSSEPVAIDTLDIELPPTSTPQMFTVTTRRPHHRLDGQNVLINQVFRADDLNTRHPWFNRSFAIKTISATQFTCEFRYELADFPPDFPGIYFNPDFPPSIGVDFHGPAAFSGTGCLTEGNSAFDCRSGHYIDTGSTRDGVVRDNYYSNSFRGIYHDLSSPDGFRDGVTLTLLPGSPPIAQYQTPAEFPHRLSRGQAVEIRLAEPRFNYSGIFLVKDRIDDVTFTYEPHTAPDGSVPPPTAVGKYAARWQTNRFVIENNVYDLYANDANSAGGPTAIGAQGINQMGPYLFPQLIIRGNLIRSIDNAPDTGSYLHRTRGMFLHSTQRALIDQNLITAAEIYPMAFSASRNLRTFNNETPGGSALRAQQFFGERIADDVATLIEDALMLSL